MKLNKLGLKFVRKKNKDENYVDGMSNEHKLLLVEDPNVISRILIFKSKQNCI